MKRILLIFLLFFSLKGLSQQEQEEDSNISFSQALYLHLPSYIQKAEKAYRLKKFEEAKILFDSLVNFKLKGSYMDNFTFKNLRGKEISLNKFQNPIYLLTYASWHTPGKGELPALNQLAEKYSDEIDFILVLWDDKKTANEFSKNFNQHISVLYFDEKENNGAYAVKQLKHSLGFPTCFLLDDQKQIMSITRNVVHPYGISKEESFKMNYEAIEKGIANHLLPQQEERSNQSSIAVRPE